MIPARTLLRAAVPLVLHAAAREVDRATGALLHTSLDLPDFVGQALALVDPADALRTVAAWLVAGLALGAGLAGLRRRRDREPWGAACGGVVPAYLPLLLRPVVTLLALGSLALRPTYPYGFTLPVALSQDWAIALDLAALGATLAILAPPLRLPAPRAAEIFFIVLLGYALMVPGWARSFEGHPGNEPKYLRMGLALGHRLSLDVDAVDVTMEELPVEPLAGRAARAGTTLASESLEMLRSLPGALSTQAIRATRVARQTIRGKHGGVFHVLAPGPSLLLAPTLRIDRALNRLRGTPGRLAVTLLVWNAMGAALVVALYLLLRDATGRAGLSAALAGFFALVPPFVFYPYQFFPEMPAALLLAVVLRTLLFGKRFTAGAACGLGLLLATLPWLHQKFLPVWGVLVMLSIWIAVDRLVTLKAFLWLALPQALTLYLTALYNFAISGSVRPDALFRAWGPAGVTTAHLGQGFFGLLLDQRYGILPYAPLYLLAGAGLLAAGHGAGRLRLALPAALVYYMTVAAADDWHGAVSNLGRYFMPVAPYAVALLAVALASAARRSVAALALALAAWTGLCARALWLDPHAANEATQLLAKSSYADGAVYVPNLFVTSFALGAPGLYAQLGCWALFGLALAASLALAARGRGVASPSAALFGLLGLVLACGGVLERWPSAYGGPRFRDAIELRPGTVAFVAGSGEVERGALVQAGNGVLELLVRSRVPLAQLTLIAQGDGRVRVPRRPDILAERAGAWAALPLEPLARLSGRRGVTENLYRQRLEVRGDGPLFLRLVLAE